jgi:hypothetical protein
MGEVKEAADRLSLLLGEWTFTEEELRAAGLEPELLVLWWRRLAEQVVESVRERSSVGVGCSPRESPLARL